MEEAPTTSTDSIPTFSLGIDIGKEALELALLNREGPTAKTSVSNDGEGRKAIRDWLEEWGAVPEKTRVCMEASGGYEEAVATCLHEAGYRMKRATA